MYERYYGLRSARSIVAEPAFSFSPSAIVRR
jgi:hypothetical protein